MTQIMIGLTALLSILGNVLPNPLTEYGIVSYQNTIYLAGGYDGALRSSNVLEYNPVTEEWTVNSQLTQSRGKMPAMMVDTVFFPPCE